jgi:hypothetical protein
MILLELFCFIRVDPHDPRLKMRLVDCDDLVVFLSAPGPGAPTACD